MNRVVCIFRVVLSVLLIGASVVSVVAEPLFPPPSETRLRLTEEYALRHYGVRTHRLSDPRMIVIHFTAYPTLPESVRAFAGDRLSRERTDIAGHGDLNIGVHYFVDRDGTVHPMLPEDMIGRHTIGFNYTSLGIENIGASASALTEKQIAANVALVADLVARHPSLEYLIGHHEYLYRHLPHYALFLGLDKGYGTTRKDDPGPAFMARLRSVLADRFGIRLKD